MCKSPVAVRDSRKALTSPNGVGVFALGGCGFALHRLREFPSNDPRPASGHVAGVVDFQFVTVDDGFDETGLLRLLEQHAAA